MWLERWLGACSLQMGVCKRLWLTESFMPSWKFIVRLHRPLAVGTPSREDSGIRHSFGICMNWHCQ